MRKQGQWLFFGALLFFSSQCFGQLYSYQELSKFSYKKEKDSIRKAWTCPVISTVKATQAKYKEIWDSRTEFLMSAIESNDFIRDEHLYDYVNGVIADIYRNNKEDIKEMPMLFIDRSANVNAYSLGNHVLIVNAGMIAFCKSREELALAIAHELSHEVLNHSANAMRETAILLTSDEYKKSLDAILESEYERLTKLRKIITSYTFSRNRHNRYHESEADSLAIIMLGKSKIGFDPVFFLRLDNADTEYQQELKKPVKNYFQAYDLPVEDAWFVKRSKGLSSRVYNFKDSTVQKDSLKTHPDCVERFEKTKGKATLTGNLTPIPSAIKEKARKVMIWDLFYNMRLTACLYQVLLEKDKLNPDSWYDFMMYNVLAGLYYANTQLNRFNAINIQPKEYVSKSYYELQTMLEQIPPENLETIYDQMGGQSFWSSVNQDAQHFKSLFSELRGDEKEVNKKIARAAKDFMNAYPASMYCEFASMFK